LVLVRDLPCSGKIDGQYLLNALEGGVTGLCVVACPRGQCQLSQGNYRAEIRVETIKRLLGEIGVESDRVELLFCGLDDPPDRLETLVREAVGRICSLGDSPIRRAAPSYAEG
jgi:F420-non-reducing hydrogenase iron-sulfur subunit